MICRGSGKSIKVFRMVELLTTEKFHDTICLSKHGDGSMTPQFTEPLQQALQQAVESAKQNNHTEVTEYHLLHELYHDPSGYFPTLSSSLGMDISAVEKELESQLKKVARFTMGPS